MSDNKRWLVYDGRAAGGKTDDATVYISCDSLKEARRDVRSDFNDGIIFEYDVSPTNQLLNGRMVS